MSSPTASPRIDVDDKEPNPEEQQQSSRLMEDIRFILPESWRKTTREVAGATAPDFSLIFFTMFSLAAYLHESHPWHVGVVISGWLLLQCFMYVTDEDFQSDIFWNSFSLAGYFIMYLLFGIIWSLCKLYLDVWQKQMPDTLHAAILVCTSDAGKVGCTMELLNKMKWRLMQSATAFPISIVYTLSRDPLRLLNNVLFDTFANTYASVMSSAAAAFRAKQLADAATNTATSWSALGWVSLYVLAYLAIGYAWTHIKLFVDVWRGTLPPKVDAMARDIWHNNNGNYWNFVTSIKYLVIQWVIFWPVSILYTILRHPMRLIIDLVYQLSQRKYVWIVNKAMETRMKQE